ncbi:MAG: hypothetical protein DRQ48_00875 [Gammaproteobacteria bacterium]|nr:MAG: hypothetical protein DRQ44_00495 [Gammaproteobacteria bacterium]RKZ72232.1 MAG: hypothetical protein DRQ48_00875 [Gammaproteobacteria bacterium]
MNNHLPLIRLIREQKEIPSHMLATIIEICMDYGLYFECENNELRIAPEKSDLGKYEGLTATVTIAAKD